MVRIHLPPAVSLRTIGSSAVPWGGRVECACGLYPGVLTLARPDGGRIELPAERSTTGSGNRQGRPAHRPFRGLLGVHSRCSLHTLAQSPNRDRYSKASAISLPP